MESTHITIRDGLSVRAYSPNDFKMLDAWWRAHNEPGPTPDMIPNESTYIALSQNTPVASVSLILTNVPSYCHVENFIANPEVTGYERGEAIKLLLSHIQREAKKHGYQNLLALSYREKIKGRYEALGFVETMKNLSSFVIGTG